MNGNGDLHWGTESLQVEWWDPSHLNPFLPPRFRAKLTSLILSREKTGKPNHPRHKLYRCGKSSWELITLIIQWVLAIHTRSLRFVILMYICAQSCPILCDPMDYSPLGFPVHGIFQARILGWVTISYSRDLPDPGIEPATPASPAQILYHCATCGPWTTISG